MSVPLVTLGSGQPFAAPGDLEISWEPRVKPAGLLVKNVPTMACHTPCSSSLATFQTLTVMAASARGAGTRGAQKLQSE